MSKLRAIVIVAAAVLSTGCSHGAEDPRFTITTQRDNDKVEVKAEKQTTIFSVHSPFGISQALIERNDENWPDRIIVRLHLKGLESFNVSDGKVTLEAAVSSEDGPVRLWKDGKEDSPLDTASPYWTKIRTVGKAGSAVSTLPLDDGYFEIPLPTALFEDNPKSITVKWIDFYR